MTPKIPIYLSKFRPIIEKFYRNDEKFREIYNDYQTYRDALQYWEQSDSDEASARMSEYANLVRELEEELTEILKK
jgi:exonuclease V gamma subunit